MSPVGQALLGKGISKMKGKGGHGVIGLFVLLSSAEGFVCCDGMFESFSAFKRGTDRAGTDGLTLATVVSLSLVAACVAVCRLHPCLRFRITTFSGHTLDRHRLVD